VVDGTFSPRLEAFLKPESHVHMVDGVAVVSIDFRNRHTRANAEYYDHRAWAEGYFRACHRDDAFKDRWRHAVGSLDDKIVVDIGCGPGNVFATLGGTPKVLIGVDVSRGSLQMAKKNGYTPLQADGHDLPLISAFADLVVVNATLHHCDDMAKVLKEAARLVRPGGQLVCDHDPQLSAWNWRGIGKLFYNIRLPLYRLFLHHSYEEQIYRMKSETHHRPGHGLTPEFYASILEPLGFDVRVYPHNANVGREVFDRTMGRADLKYRIGQRLSGIDPNSPKGALTLMCVAVRNHRVQTAIAAATSLVAFPDVVAVF